jgi:hypothetical protein
VSEIKPTAQSTSLGSDEVNESVADRRAEARSSGDRRATRSWFAWPRSLVALYTATFVATEALGAYVGVEWQIGLVAALTLVSVNHALFGFRNARTSAVVMTALFTMRLITLTLPISGTSAPTRAGILAVFALLIARLAIWVLAYDVNETRETEGFPLRTPLVSRRITSAFVALMGIPIGAFAYEILKPAELVVTPLLGSAAIAWACMCVFLVLGAWGEEVLFRQLVAAMVQHTGNSQTPWISGILFGATYLGVGLGTGHLLLAGLALLTGALFAWSCERTGSLRGPIVGHAIISLLVFVVLPNWGW